MSKVNKNKETITIIDIYQNKLYESKTAKTIKEAVEEAVAKKIDLTNVHLTGTDLMGANLANAKFSGASLRWANLNGANLSGANLNDANLIGADLSNANLNGANLSSANLSDANLRRANLRRANLTGADLSNADIINAQLTKKKGDRVLQKKIKNKICKLTDDQIINIVCDALCEFGKTCEKKLGCDAKNYVQYVGFFILGSIIAKKESKATLKTYFKQILDRN